MSFESLQKAAVDNPGGFTCGAAGLQLLGRVYAKSGQKKRATDMLRIRYLGCNEASRETPAAHTLDPSLVLDPLLWTSFDLLCKLGEDYDPSETWLAALQSETGTGMSSGLIKCERRAESSLSMRHTARWTEAPSDSGAQKGIVHTHFFKLKLLTWVTTDDFLCFTGDRS